MVAQHKHGKASEESANPLRAVQILANVTGLAFGNRVFGMFRDVKKQRFGTKYEGRFHHAHGRSPFLEMSDYSGDSPFSDNETYVFDLKERRALPLEPLVLWEHCKQHPDLENGHCYMFDSVEPDGSFTYKAVGSTCVLRVSSSSQYDSLVDRLKAICEKDTNISDVKV